MISKGSKKAFLVLSVDPDLAERNHIAIDRALSPIEGDVVDHIILEGASFLVFESIDAALQTYCDVQKQSENLPFIDLNMIVYYEGFSHLMHSQAQEHLPEKFVGVLHHTAM